MTDKEEINELEIYKRAFKYSCNQLYAVTGLKGSRDIRNKAYSVKELMEKYLSWAREDIENGR